MLVVSLACACVCICKPAGVALGFGPGATPPPPRRPVPEAERRAGRAGSRAGSRPSGLWAESPSGLRGGHWRRVPGLTDSKTSRSTNSTPTDPRRIPGQIREVMPVGLGGPTPDRSRKQATHKESCMPVSFTCFIRDQRSPLSRPASPPTPTCRSLKAQGTPLPHRPSSHRLRRVLREAPAKQVQAPRRARPTHATQGASRRRPTDRATHHD